MKAKTGKDKIVSYFEQEVALGFFRGLESQMRGVASGKAESRIVLGTVIFYLFTLHAEYVSSFVNLLIKFIFLGKNLRIA